MNNLSAVTGAFSYSGRYITKHLLARGERVITLTGHPNRPDPFAGKVQAFPLRFDDPAGLRASLRGVDTLYNTYWVRFDRGDRTHSNAVANTKILIREAAEAGVRRIVHISISNPSADSPLPYFRGKAELEQAVRESGLSYAILRPTVLFGAGTEDVLINNIAWLLRRFPFFTLPGDGGYRLQPVHVDDLAGLAVDWGARNEDSTLDAVGPEIYSFTELVGKVAETVGRRRPLLHVPPGLALAMARIVSPFVGDVILTRDEIDGLMAGLLVSADPPACSSRLSDWLHAYGEQIGRQYASEIARHYR